VRTCKIVCISVWFIVWGGTDGMICVKYGTVIIVPEA
jgi:hypothetical protein